MRAAGKALVGVVVLGALVWSCGPRAGPEVEPRMVGHYENVSRLYAEAAAGRLDGVRREANELLARETGEGLPVKVSALVEELRTYAGLAARAPDVTSAASAVARVAASCGSCHQEMDRHLKYEAVTGPPEGDTPVATRMLRHWWAADRLWDGLVGPSDEAWRAGAGVLRDAPLYTDELTHDVEQYEAVTKLAWKVHEIGARAGAVLSPADRAALYGELLASCASCHRLQNDDGK